MEPKVLLAELRTLDETMPDFRDYFPSSRSHHKWLAKAEVLVQKADDKLGKRLSTSIDDIGRGWHDQAVTSFVLGLQRAIVHMEQSGIGQQGDQMFGPGAVYDFFKALNSVLSSAQQSVFIVDPYLDDSVFDSYISSVHTKVKVRLLAGKGSPNLKTAISNFTTQHGTAIEARLSKEIHDRVIFVDDKSCWVLGQSIKDAAKSKATYLAPLDAETTGMKLPVYESIWTGATPI